MNWIDKSRQVRCWKRRSRRGTDASGRHVFLAGPRSGRNRGRAPTHLILTSHSESLSGQFPGRRVLREIDDPHTGDRWLLMPNPANPGGPGRLVRYAAPGPDTPGPGRRWASPAGLRPAPAPALVPEALLPVIRTGDSLIVEENTALVEARLEAIALGPAASGSPLLVRLRIGGNVVRAVALGPGRAAFAVETEARP